MQVGSKYISLEISTLRSKKYVCCQALKRRRICIVEDKYKKKTVIK